MMNAFNRTRLPDTVELPASLLLIEGGAFSYSRNVTCIKVPMKIDSLSNSFYHTSSLSSVTLPTNLYFLAYGAFSEDTLLRTIYNLRVKPVIINEKIQRAFFHLDRSKCRLIVPTASVELYKSTPVWRDFMIEAGGLSVGVCFNDKHKGDVEGLENRFYKKGEKLTLVAYPRSGCTFSGWKTPDGKVISTSNTLPVTVTQDTMLQACFEGEVSVREAEQTVRTGADVMLFPNPAGDFFSVRSESPVEELAVCDLSGRVLLRTERTFHADVSALPKGIYLVRVRTENGSCVKKLVKR